LRIQGDKIDKHTEKTNKRVSKPSHYKFYKRLWPFYLLCFIFWTFLRWCIW